MMGLLEFIPLTDTQAIVVSDAKGLSSVYVATSYLKDSKLGTTEGFAESFSLFTNNPSLFAFAYESRYTALKAIYQKYQCDTTGINFEEVENSFSNSLSMLGINLQFARSQIRSKLKQSHQVNDLLNFSNNTDVLNWLTTQDKRK